MARSRAYFRGHSQGLGAVRLEEAETVAGLGYEDYLAEAVNLEKQEARESEVGEGCRPSSGWG